MAKTTKVGKKKINGGIVKLKVAVERLQKSLLLKKSSDDEITVPDDVKEGHFAVIAVNNDQLKRFIVPLVFLTHPSFLRLLEQAAEEYGFYHDGALTVPCLPSVLERILAEQWAEERGSTVVGGGGADTWGGSYNETMVKSC